MLPFVFIHKYYTAVIKFNPRIKHFFLKCAIFRGVMPLYSFRCLYINMIKLSFYSEIQTDYQRLPDTYHWYIRTETHCTR